MPRLEREYPEVRFAAETVRLAYELFKQLVGGQVPEERRSRLLLDGEWQHLNEAHEFFDVYTPEVQSAELPIVDSKYRTNSTGQHDKGSGGAEHQPLLSEIEQTLGELVQLQLIEPLGLRDGHIAYGITAHARNMTEPELTEALNRDLTTEQPTGTGEVGAPAFGECPSCGHAH